MHLIKKNPLEENLGVVNFEGINVFNLKHLWVAYNGLLSSTGIEVKKKKMTSTSSCHAGVLGWKPL